MDILISVLTGSSPYNAEIRSFFMAFQGAMNVRSGANKSGQMNWWHALCVTAVTAFGGGLLNPIWLGKPAALIAGGDVAIPIVIIAFVLANYTPIGSYFPVKLVTTVWAQLFRSLGTMAFITAAYNDDLVPPSKYYPIPVLGPVLYGALLGNMGAFFLKGFHGHLEKGMPFPFQNGFVCGLFYHLYANDHEGPLGEMIRTQFAFGQGSMDDNTFATLVVSAFMVVTGLLQLPEFLGPSFNPFLAPFKPLLKSSAPKEAKAAGLKKKNA